MTQSSLAADLRTLVTQACHSGFARATLGQHYRVSLLPRPWRLLVLPMPKQYVGSGGELDPTGNAWDTGAKIVAHLIAQHLAVHGWAGGWEKIQNLDPIATASDDRLHYTYKWVA